VGKKARRLIFRICPKCGYKGLSEEFKVEIKRMPKSKYTLRCLVELNDQLSRIYKSKYKVWNAGDAKRHEEYGAKIIKRFYVKSGTRLGDARFWSLDEALEYISAFEVPREKVEEEFKGLNVAED